MLVSAEQKLVTIQEVSCSFNSAVRSVGLWIIREALCEVWYYCILISWHRLSLLKCDKECIAQRRINLQAAIFIIILTVSFCFYCHWNSAMEHFVSGNVLCVCTCACARYSCSVVIVFCFWKCILCVCARALLLLHCNRVSLQKSCSLYICYTNQNV